MKQIAVVTSMEFGTIFRKGSPFIKGIDYFPHMFKNELNASGYELVPYDQVSRFDDICAIFHMSRYRSDVIKNHPDMLHIYLAGEPSIVVPSNSEKIIPKLADDVYDAILSVHAFRLNHERIFPYYLPVDICYLGGISKMPSKLACMFSGDKTAYGKELYSLRRRVIKYAEKNCGDSFRFYGPNWGKPYSAFSCYGGAAQDKRIASEPYKFMICFENDYGTIDGISEKIFDALCIGKVPVYLGAPNIADYVPSDCFVDYSQFNSEKECFDYLQEMPEEEYRCYLRNIEKFMTSKDTKERFSAKALCETMIKICNSVTPHKNRKTMMLDFYRQTARLYFVSCKIKRLIAI